MTKTEMEVRLKELRAQEVANQTEIRTLYRRSLVTAKEEDKLCADWVAEDLSTESPLNPIEYPIEVNGIHFEEEDTLRPSFGRKGTKWVAVRSCNKKHGNKTYLGILLGDMALSVRVTLSPEGILQVEQAMYNPAMYVPELHEVIFGCGSWWTPIDTPESLRQISNADIENVWYVRAMKDVESKEAIAKGVGD